MSKSIKKNRCSRLLTNSFANFNYVLIILTVVLVNQALAASEAKSIFELKINSPKEPEIYISIKKSENKDQYWVSYSKDHGAKAIEREFSKEVMNQVLQPLHEKKSPVEKWVNDSDCDRSKNYRMIFGQISIEVCKSTHAIKALHEIQSNVAIILK